MSGRMPIYITGLATSLGISAAIAGPPMVTDDTGTASPGVFEFIVFTAHEERDSGESTEGPALDIAYGVSETIEVSLVVPRQRVQDAGESSRSGWGAAAVGMKWRFFDGENSALAIAPSFTTPLSHSSTIRGLIEDTSIFTVPLLGSLSLGNWEFTGNVGYSISSSTFDAISLGASAGYEVTANFRLLGEIWGVDFVDDGASEGFLNWRAGIQWGLGKNLALLGAYGANVWSQLGSENELRHEYFVGVQYNLGE